MAKTKESNKRSASPKINLTIKIDKDTRRKIRILAAEKNMSISGLISEILSEISDRADVRKSQRSESAL
jgi:hypothetical protein